MKRNDLYKCLENNDNDGNMISLDNFKNLLDS
jgi:hypothetical protein